MPGSAVLFKEGGNILEGVMRLPRVACGKSSQEHNIDGILILYEKHKVGQRPEGTIVVGIDPRGNLNTGKKLSNREVLLIILLNKW